MNSLYNKLNYLGVDINWLFILFSLSVLQWIVIGFFVYQKREFLYEEVVGFEDREKKISFRKDYFFWFWNIYPIVFYLFFYYIETMWSSWFTKLLMIDNSAHNIEYLYRSMFLYLNQSGTTSIWKDIDIIILFVFFIPISIWAAFFKQNDKVKKFKVTKTRIYWWDKDICNKIFYTRNIFLFFNLVLISFITLIITKIAIFTIYSLSFDNLKIFPFHPDKYGGLRTFMEISAVIISIYLLRSAIGLVGYLDHRNEQGRSHLATDGWNFSFLLIGILYLSLLFNKIKFLLEVSYTQYRVNEIFSVQNYIDWINRYMMEVNSSKQISSNVFIEFMNDIQNYYSSYNFNSFPLDLYLYINPLFSFIIPISLWFLFNSYGFYSDKRKKDEKEKFA